ncbi:MAG: 50S ribosomal protein L33 [Planctomycetes bacterium]|nr:50S ribosomal protein L33 [Planctomycetota bacterium]NUQ33993.1 50S ribosomal protein L33 [Planctomycetaceae bacterium]
MAKDNRQYVFMECSETGMRLYRTEKKMKGQQKKLELKKYNPKLRKHTLHVEKKK